MRRRIGSIEWRNGVARARLRVNGKLEPVGSFATEEEADAAILLLAEALSKDVPVAGYTLDSWGRKWLDARELDGVHRSVSRDRHTWKRAAKAKFAGLPLSAITVRDIRGWVADQIKDGAAKQTVANALNLLRVCLEAACNEGHLEVNPARDVRVPKVARTKDAWTWLRLEEIERLLSADIGDETRDILTVAIYTGLRAGELFGLEWLDVDSKARTATIRYSWKRTPTKGGVIRVVNLFGPASAALERQRARSGKRSKVFPAIDGAARSRDQTVNLEAALEAAGIRRHVRVHDLRHTCASHLVSGSWGRAWTLEEIARHLGHVSSASTRRYAHLCPEGLARAVRETNPEAHTRVLTLVPSRSQRPQNEGLRTGANHAKSAEEKGFEPLVALPPRRFSKPNGTQAISVAYAPGGTLGERAYELLTQLQGGKCSEADVAKLAAELLSNPPPAIAAAQRFLTSVGTPDAAMAAVAFLELVGVGRRG